MLCRNFESIQIKNKFFTNFKVDSKDSVLYGNFIKTIILIPAILSIVLGGSVSKRFCGLRSMCAIPFDLKNCIADAVIIIKYHFKNYFLYRLLT